MLNPAEPHSFYATPSNVIQHLTERGQLSVSELNHVLLATEQSDIDDARILLQMGLIAEDALCEAFADCHQLSKFENVMAPEAPVTSLPITVRFIKSAEVLPLSDVDGVLTLAMTNPEDDFTLNALKMATGRQLERVVATRSQIHKHYERLYGEGKTQMSELAAELGNDGDVVDAETISRLKSMAEEAPIVRLVNMMISRAIDMSASDIHIEPFENSLHIRYRIDGILQDAESPPTQSAAAVISRIKIMANLNIAERRLPQDGRMQVKTAGRDIDLRVSSTPTLHGESLVMRILDKNKASLDLDKLGLTQDNKAALLKTIQQPHGIVLVTGPTGSGKTTTLYAALQRLNTVEKKILTVEDPVEYQLEGINQIQVKPQIGLNFADALRSIVRQDPDVLMIGEMRDLETARIAIQAALTGHLVFSTLHTNDAGSSVTRLLDMGVEDYLMTSTLNAVVAQRLIRKLCEHCREAYQPSESWWQELGSEQVMPANLYRAKGCQHCAETGYQGRTIISEILVMNDAVCELILARADGSRIQKKAIETGMLSLKEDGLKQAIAGLTSVEEVLRVAQDAA